MQKEASLDVGLAALLFGVDQSAVPRVDVECGARRRLAAGRGEVSRAVRLRVQPKLRDPQGTLVRRPLPRSDARDGIVRQRNAPRASAVRQRALQIKEQVEVEIEVHRDIVVAVLAPCFRQIVRLLRDDVQEEAMLDVDPAALLFGVDQDAVPRVDVEGRARRRLACDGCEVSGALRLGV